MFASIWGRLGLASLAMTAGLLSAGPALASVEECAALWVERNKPFAEAGLCVDTTLWKNAFPNISCKYASGADVSLPQRVADRLADIRTRETQLGCRIDSGFRTPQSGVRALWLEIGDQASIYSARDGSANLRNAPSAKSGEIVGRLEDGAQVKIIGRAQSPDNNALWYRVSHADNVGRLRTAFVHYASVFPRHEVVAQVNLAHLQQAEVITTDGAATVPAHLAMRFWTSEHPVDIWPVLSAPGYSRDGRELMTFHVAFSAPDGWVPDDLAGTAALCRWQEGRQRAACAGEAGDFQIVATRDAKSGALLSLGLRVPEGAGRIVPAGFERQLTVSSAGGDVQLAITLGGLATMKSGVLQSPTPAQDQPGSAAPPPASTTPVAAAPAETSPAASSVPAQAAEAVNAFDDILSLID